MPKLAHRFAPAVLTATALLAAPLAAQERIAVGDEAPDFELTSSTGTIHRLSSLRGDEKVLLVFYRGTW